MQPEQETEVVIIGAARTAVGSFLGGMANFSAAQLGATAISAALARAKVAAKDVDEIVMGQVLTAGSGQNPARQAAWLAGIGESTTALAVNQLCGSGMRSVALGQQALQLGESEIIVAGGQESMSQAPHLLNLRTSKKLGNQTLQDSLILDGLHCALTDQHMGLTAEAIAERWQISREQQDEFAVRSQQLATAAQQQGKWQEEIVPLSSSKFRDIKSGNQGQQELISKDEFIKPATNMAKLARLQPAFRAKGSVTAGNAAGINDGAAAMVLTTAKSAIKRGFSVMARIKSWATTGIDPNIMGMGPVTASRKALARAGWQLGDIAVVELNEAFAAQSLAVIQELGLRMDSTNPNGGAIALGHPIGASGARIIVSLIYELQRRGGGRGLACMCIGGGMGIALCLEVG